MSRLKLSRTENIDIKNIFILLKKLKYVGTVAPKTPPNRFVSVLNAQTIIFKLHSQASFYFLKSREKK